LKTQVFRHRGMWWPKLLERVIIVTVVAVPIGCHGCHIRHRHPRTLSQLHPNRFSFNLRPLRSPQPTLTRCPHVTETSEICVCAFVCAIPNESYIRHKRMKQDCAFWDAIAAITLHNELFRVTRPQINSPGTPSASATFKATPAS